MRCSLSEERSIAEGGIFRQDQSFDLRSSPKVQDKESLAKKTAGGGRQFDRGGVSLVLPSARKRRGGEDRNLLRELAIRRKKPRGLPSARFVHPRVAELRYSEFQVEGSQPSSK